MIFWLSNAHCYNCPSDARNCKSIANCFLTGTAVLHLVYFFAITGSIWLSKYSKFAHDTLREFWNYPDGMAFLASPPRELCYISAIRELFKVFFTISIFIYFLRSFLIKGDHLPSSFFWHFFFFNNACSPYHSIKFAAATTSIISFEFGSMIIRKLDKKFHNNYYTY